MITVKNADHTFIHYVDNKDLCIEVLGYQDIKQLPAARAVRVSIRLVLTMPTGILKFEQPISQKLVSFCNFYRSYHVGPIKYPSQGRVFHWLDSS